MSSLAERLARAASRITLEGATESVRQRLGLLVADTMATMISGAMREDVKAMVRTLISGSGVSSVVGDADGRPSITAAIANGAGIAAEQLQDGHRPAKGHPMAHLLPALLSVAEEIDADGVRLGDALLAGYESGVRIGLVMGGTRSGVHDIGTWGTIGAAAGVAHLRSGGDPGQIEAAIELAASAPLQWESHGIFNGANSQHLALGSACALAVLLGGAAIGGAKAPDGALERFYLPTVADVGDLSVVDRSFDADGSWSSWEILNGYIKVHPTCAHLHGANDAVEEVIALRQGVAFRPSEIARVQLETYGFAAVFDDAAPSNDLAARFSIPFTVAAGLIHGGLRRESFFEVNLKDRELRALARRVEVIHARDLDSSYPEGRPARLAVTLTDGTVIRTSVLRPRGDGASEKDRSMVVQKNEMLLAPFLSAAEARELFEASVNFTRSSARNLGEWLRSIPSGRH